MISHHYNYRGKNTSRSKRSFNYFVKRYRYARAKRNFHDFNDYQRDAFSYETTGVGVPRTYK